MSEYRESTVALAQVVTATTNVALASEGFGGARSIRAAIFTSAVSGTTPTLDVTIEDTLDGTNWFVVGTFTQITTATAQAINITNPFAERLRARMVVGGTTPSFTVTLRVAVNDA